MLKERIEAYIPQNEQERKDKELMLQYIDRFPDILSRKNEMAHFTASNWIINREKTKVLMVYHNIYQSWTWTGGHADGEEDLLKVALKEAKEETGISSFQVISNTIYHLQILPVDAHIKHGNYVAPHLHLDCCFLLQADEQANISPNLGENSGVKWIPIHQVEQVTSEPRMKPIYRKMI